MTGLHGGAQVIHHLLQRLHQFGLFGIIGNKTVGGQPRHLPDSPERFLPPR